MRTLVLSSIFLFATVSLISSANECQTSLQALAPVNTTSARLIHDSLIKLLSKKGKLEEIKPKYQGGFNDRRVETVQMKGVPAEVRVLSDTELSSMVFRHYINGDAYFKEGKELGLISSAATSYVQLAPGVRRAIFEDITGVFLTLPELSASEVGVQSESDTHYLDLKIPSGVQVVELEKNRIYLIPLPPRYHAWVVEAFQKYKRKEYLPAYLIKMCQEIEAREGERDISTIFKVQLQVLSGQ